MGFSHATATHHFRLTADGGIIEVEANDPKDATRRDQIRQHLVHITQMFSNSGFPDIESALENIACVVSVFCPNFLQCKGFS